MNVSITSDEVNYLVYRYLLESGFTHTSFAFSYEAAIHKVDLKGANVKPGALVNMIQKGLQYLEVETHVNEDGTERRCVVPVTLFGSHTCEIPEDDKSLYKQSSGAVSVTSLPPAVTLPAPGSHTPPATSAPAVLSLPVNTPTNAAQNNGASAAKPMTGKSNAKQPADDASVGQKRERKEDRRTHKVDKRARKDNGHGNQSGSGTHASLHSETFAATTKKGSIINALASSSGPNTGSPRTPLEIGMQSGDVKDEARRQTNFGGDAPATPGPESPAPLSALEITPDCVSMLKGHRSEVFVCGWNPVAPLLATGSGDGTARIWSTVEPIEGTAPLILDHPSLSDQKDVTTLEWHPTGQMLATGTYDGHARIWNIDGTLKLIMQKHAGPIFSLKWNKRGDLLLSGSVDHSAIVWDATTGEARQQFKLHTSPTLDVDWRDNTTFATCSTDKQIFVCQLGTIPPLAHLTGHTDEVNAVKWDPTGKFLASCSDDTTVRIWIGDEDGDSQCKWVLKGHHKAIYTLRWNPVVTNDRRTLATASFDSTIRIWDAQRGECLHVLQRHSEAVYSLGFSPNGLFLASGSFDQSLNIWSMNDGAVVKSYSGNSEIFEVAWNTSSRKVAACFADNTVVVLHLSQLLELPHSRSMNTLPASAIG